MATTVLQVTDDWSAAGRYTSSGVTELNFSNSGGGLKRWVTTTDDTLPVIRVSVASPIPPLMDKAMTLNDGDRIWFAGAKGTVTVET